jgi:hypothetical protein
MSSRAWGVCGAIGTTILYQFLRIKFGKLTAHIFGFIMVVACIVSCWVYVARLKRLLDNTSEPPPTTTDCVEDKGKPNADKTKLG